MSLNCKPSSCKSIASLGVIGFVLPIIWSMPALASSLPRYDVPSYCKQLGDMAGGSSLIVQTCVESEQQSYNTLKANWDRIPAKMQNYCDELARMAGGTYQIMETCIQQEATAAQGIPDFQY